MDSGTLAAIAAVPSEERERLELEARLAREQQERARLIEEPGRISRPSGLSAKGTDDCAPPELRLIKAAEKCMLLLVDAAFWAFTAALVYSLFKY